MEHPIFEEIERFVKTGEPERIKSHMEDCDECKAIAEGLSMIVVSSEAKEVSTENFLEESAARSLEKIKQSTESTKTRTLRPRWYMIAASLLIIAAITFFLPSSGQTLDQVLNQEITSHYAAPIEIRSGTTSDYWNDFREYYINEDFDSAYDLLNTQPDSIMNAEKHFYKGLSLIYSTSPDFKKAIIIFNDLANGQSRFSSRALWFQTLCMVQIGDRQSATPLLQRLIDENDYKANEARKLLDLFPGSGS